MAEELKEVEPGVFVVPGTGIKIRLRKLSDYRPNEKNPIQHNPRNFGLVRDSIQKLGALRSGFSSKGKILGGNLTQEAMADAGIEHVIEIETDGKWWPMHERPDLTEEMAQLAAYYDQQSSFQATWDADQVRMDMSDGIVLTPVFYEDELRVLVGAVSEEEWAALIPDPLPPVEMVGEGEQSLRVIVTFNSPGEVHQFFTTFGSEWDGRRVLIRWDELRND